MAKRSANKPHAAVRIGIAGGGPLLDPVIRAYAAQPRLESLAVYSPDKEALLKFATDSRIHSVFSEFDEFAAQAEAVEVLDLGADRDIVARSLLEKGRHVSLQKPFAYSMEQADALMAAAHRGRAFLRVNDYSLFFEPHRRVRRLIREGEIGEVCAIRVRSNLAGRGGSGPLPDLLKGEKAFFHPAFDKYALAVYLLGGVESVCCYHSSMKPRRGGRIVAGCKFRAPGRYGVFEHTFAPDTEIRATGLPVDDTLEIAGTDGIIWCNHFHGKLTEAPWIEVRRGKKHYTLGVGSGMALDWEQSLEASAAHFLERVARGRRPELSAAHARKALAVQIAVQTAARENKEVSVDSIQ